MEKLWDYIMFWIIGPFGAILFLALVLWFIDWITGED